jgi:hypothetical protein
MPASKPARQASAPVRVATQHIVPMPKIRPADTVQVAMAAITPTPLPRPSIPADAGVIAQHGQWVASQKPDLPAVMTAPFEVASADTMTTASASPLAYADVGPVPASSRLAPMGASLSRAQASRSAAERLASAGHASLTGAYVADGLMNAPLSGGHAEGVWLRAAMLAPSVSRYLTATHFGERDMRALERFMHKPAASLMLSFAGDPAHGLRSDGFSGQAVVFLATATYRLRTAALQR